MERLQFTSCYETAAISLSGASKHENDLCGDCFSETDLVFSISLSLPHRRIKVGFPAELRRTAVEDVQLLLPGQELRLPMEIVLSGVTGKSLRLDIRSDKGAFTGQLDPQPWDLLTPVVMSAADFENYRRRFAGLGEASKVFTLAALGVVAGSGGAQVEQELVSRFRRLFNVHIVQGAGCGELLLAGSKKDMVKEDKVLMTILSGRCVVLHDMTFTLPLLEF